MKTLALPSADVREEALCRARTLAAGLFPHQIDGVAFLLSRRRAILADDMGLGKTRQSIVALATAEPMGPYLVVVPASVKQNWQREILLACPDAEVHIVGPSGPPAATYRGWVVVNYDILSKHLEALELVPWTGLVFDEAHYLKNHTSLRSKLARSLVAAAPDAALHALTGTPLTNRPRDLFPLLQLVGHPMGRSFLSFAKRYCAAEHNGFGWVTDGASNLEELRVQLHGVMLRREKADVLDLPPKLRTWLPVSVPAGTGRGETRRVLQTLIAGSLRRAGGTSPTHADREVVDRLRLLADLSKARQKIAIAKVETTTDFIEGVLAQGEKVLVFSSFDEPVQKLAKHFGDRAVLLTGATPADRRQELVDRFQNDPSVRVFIANLVAGGVGLNLTAARQVVFNDLDWVPANHWQAEDRAYRIGQTETVNVTYMTALATVDEFVSHALRVKSALISAVVDGKEIAMEGGDFLRDLEALVRTLSPALSELKDGDADEDAVDRLLREVTAAVAAQHGSESLTPAAAALRALPEEAIQALARALTGPATQRYRASSESKAGTFYSLDVDDGDVSCSCPGFEYRGSCKHSRSLKKALASATALPPGIAKAAA